MRGAIGTRRAGLPPLPQAQPGFGLRRLAVEGLLDHGLAWENRPPASPWIMVPSGETRALALATGLPVVIDHVDEQGQLHDWMKMPVYRAHALHNKVFITGRTATMNAPLDVHVPGAHLRILVSVKPRMTVPIVAHYVEHGPVLKTRTTPEHLRQMIEFANRILVPQTNVRLQLAMQRVLTHRQIGKSLGPVIRYDPEDRQTGDEPALITRHKIDIPVKNREFPALNLFLVRAVNRKGKENELAHANPDGCCIFEDRVVGNSYAVQRGGHVLAHEVGHYLRFLSNQRDARALGIGDPQREADLLGRFYSVDDHRPTDPNNLMYPTWDGGTRLDRSQIERFNPTKPWSSTYPR
jgi:hypothetical protein